MPLLAAVAWLVFAIGRWSGSRGMLLAGGGFLIGVAASSATFYPVLRAAAPGRRIAGMSTRTYTVSGIVLCSVAAGFLLILGITQH